MKKIVFSIASLGLFVQIHAQNTGINTTNPKATLDITAKTTGTSPEGILIPRLTGDQIRLMPIGNLQESTMVYATSASTDLTAVKDKNLTEKGYFYWDGTAWQNVKGNDWKLTGNAGTDPAVNFIGTTDDQDLLIKRNNVISGFLNNSNRTTVFGVDALTTLMSDPDWKTFSFDNTAIGYNAMKNTIKQPLRGNTAIGSNSYINGRGDYNTLLGYSSYANRSLGSYNVGIGSEVYSRSTTISEIMTGGNNVGIGTQVFRHVNNLGSGNVAIGDNAMAIKSSDRTGIVGSPANFNVMIGASAGQYEMVGSQNIGLGLMAYNGVSSGNQNIALGSRSLNYAGTSSNNIAIGYESGGFNLNGNDNLFLGNYTTSFNRNTSNFLNISNFIIGTGVGDADYTNDRIGIGTITGLSTTNPISLLGQLPTNTLHVYSTANPVRFEGLQISTASTDKVVVAEASGVLKTKDASAISSASEPWYVANIANTTTPATTNTQDIFQMGNVGIGTSTPTAKLNVVSTTNVGASIEINSASTSLPNNDNLNLINVNQTVGNYSGLWFGDKAYASGTAGALIGAKWYDHNDATKSVGFDFYTQNSGSGSIKMSIMPNGDVGVGTTAPQARLHIDGIKDNPATGVPTAAQQSNDVVVSSDGAIGVGKTSPDARVSIYNTNPALGAFYVVVDNSNGGQMDDAIFASYAGSGSPQITDFKTASKGTYLSPLPLANGDVIYDLAGSARTSTGFVTLNKLSYKYEGNGTSALSSTSFVNSGSTAMTIDKNNNVGIGTSTPAAKLNVVDSNVTSGASYSGVLVQNSTTGQTANLNADGGLELYRDPNCITCSSPAISGYLDFKKNLTNDFDLRLAYYNHIGTKGAFSFINNAGNSIIYGLLDSGNVGIATTTPNSTLQVAGSFATKISFGNVVTPSDYTIILNGNITLPTADSSNTGRILVLCGDSGTSRTITGSLQDSGGIYSSVGTGTTNGSRCYTVQSTGSVWWITARN